MNFERITQIIKDTCDKAGIKEYEGYYSSEESMMCETLKNEISSFSFNTSGEMSFRCVSNGKMGNALSELITDEALVELVHRAIANAEVLDNDEEAIIFPGSEKYEKLPKKENKMVSALGIKETALDIQEKTYSQSDMVTEGTQSYTVTFVAENHLFNSYGLALGNKISNSYSIASVVLNNGKESVENDEVIRGTDKNNSEELAKKTVAGAMDKFNAGTVATGKYNTVFSAKCMRQLLSAFSSVFSAKNAMLGFSLLAGKEGCKIASDIVTITDDAMREGSALMTPFDGEGVATYRKCVVENGVLKTLLYDLKTAKKAGKTTTANGHRYGGSISIAPYCFCIEAGDDTLEELFVKADKGIYITAMKGLHAGANETTGDFSIDCEGFLIENGKLSRPVKSFTVAGNFYSFLNSIRALSNEVEMPAAGGFTCYGSPAALAYDMSVAGE